MSVLINVYTLRAIYKWHRSIYISFNKNVARCAIYILIKKIKVEHAMPINKKNLYQNIWGWKCWKFRYWNCSQQTTWIFSYFSGWEKCGFNTLSKKSKNNSFFSKAVSFTTNKNLIKLFNKRTYFIQMKKISKHKNERILPPRPQLPRLVVIYFSYWCGSILARCLHGYGSVIDWKFYLFCCSILNCWMSCGEFRELIWANPLWMHFRYQLLVIARIQRCNYFVDVLSDHEYPPEMKK